MDYNKKDSSIGALWEKTSGKGNRFFTGSIKIGGEVTKIVVFKNINKKTDKHPDYNILISIPKDNADRAETTKGNESDLPF